MGQKCCCKYCGMEYQDVRTLTSNMCRNHPAGQGHPHELYEGGVKPQYTCKYCGMSYRSMRDLCANVCRKNPAGQGKRHEAAL